jgi:hypothetical protein
MSYDPNERIAHFEETGTEPSVTDFYRMMQYHQAIRDKKQRDREEKERMRLNLYNMYENEDQNRADIREKREQLMRTSTLMPKVMTKVNKLVKMEQLHDQFLNSGNASQSVIGADTISVKGGRRTRRHKRSNKKRSNKKKHRSNKCMSRRR